MPHFIRVKITTTFCQRFSNNYYSQSLFTAVLMIATSCSTLLMMNPIIFFACSSTVSSELYSLSFQAILICNNINAFPEI